MSDECHLILVTIECVNVPLHPSQCVYYIQQTHIGVAGVVIECRESCICTCLLSQCIILTQWSKSVLHGDDNNTLCYEIVNYLFRRESVPMSERECTAVDVEHHWSRCRALLKILIMCEDV